MDVNQWRRFAIAGYRGNFPELVLLLPSLLCSFCNYIVPSHIVILSTFIVVSWRFFNPTITWIKILYGRMTGLLNGWAKMSWPSPQTHRHWCWPLSIRCSKTKNKYKHLGARSRDDLTAVVVLGKGVTLGVIACSNILSNSFENVNITILITITRLDDQSVGKRHRYTYIT